MAKVSVSGKAAFFTRKVCEDGVRFPLRLVNGDETDEWLLIRSRESETYQAAVLAEERQKASIEQIKDEDEKKKAQHESMRRLLATAIAGWSFPEECTPESARELLFEAPYLLEQIVDFFTERANFCVGASSSSPATPKRPTDSTSPQPQNQSSPSDST